MDSSRNPEETSATNEESWWRGDGKEDDFNEDIAEAVVDRNEDQYSEESWGRIDRNDIPDDSLLYSDGYASDDAQQQRSSTRNEFPDRVYATDDDHINDDFEEEAHIEATHTVETAERSDREIHRPNIATTVPQPTGIWEKNDTEVINDDAENEDVAEPPPVLSPPTADTMSLNPANPIHSPSSPSTRLTFHSAGDAAGATSVTTPSRLSFNLALPPKNSTFGIASSSNTADAAGSDLGSPPSILSPTNFAQVIRERTRQRRLQEDGAVASLRVQVTRLEAALAAACRRRVDAVRAIQDQATAAVTALEQRLAAQVTADMDRVNERLLHLEQRMSTLETRWNEDVCGFQEDIQDTKRQLQSQLQSLQDSVAQEKVAASVRHDRWVQQLQTVSNEYDSKWQQERQARIAAVASLQETMDQVHTQREINVATVEGQLQEEIRTLQNAIALEQHERRTHDEMIVQTLNRYTRNVQESLAITTGAGILPSTLSLSMLPPSEYDHHT